MANLSRSLLVLRPALTLTAAVVMWGASLTPAHAANIVFDFDTSKLPAGHTMSALANNTAAPVDSSADNSSKIQQYMNNMLKYSPGGNTAWGVTVKGAESSGAVGATRTVANAGYTGDGHVVCQNGTKDTTSHGTTTNCVPETLATYDKTPFVMTSGSYKAVIQNGKVVQNSNGAKTIQMIFSSSNSQKPITVTSISFDFEIFPDASCPSASQCPSAPDFTFLMSTGSGSTYKDVVQATVDAVAPGHASGAPVVSTAAGMVSSYSITGGASMNTGAIPGTSNVYSDVSGTGTAKEQAYQYLGHMTFNFKTPVTNPTLNFIDWPDTIAVTNINWGLGLPVPGALTLLGFGLASFVGLRRRSAPVAL